MPIFATMFKDATIADVIEATRAKEQPLSKPHKQPQSPRPIRATSQQTIQVIKAPPLSWYAKRIGDTFRVIRNDSKYCPRETHYKVFACRGKGTKGRYPGLFIRKEDCKVVRGSTQPTITPR